ncbi:MAG: flippase-like domain-containing protein [Deltaproteobacteria bacterium]|nr:flippase-like domain-containing protein [Deltaproteobacteria bacterium]
MNLWSSFVKAVYSLGEVRLSYVLTAVALYTVSVVISGARWKKILLGLGCPVRLSQTSIGIIIGIFVSNILPSSRIGGEVSRITLLRKWTPIDLKKAFVSIFYDRVAALVPSLFVVALSFPTLLRLFHRFNNIILIALLILVLMIGLFLSYRSIGKFREWVLSRRRLVHSFRINPKNFGGAIGFSSLVWLQDLLRLMVVSAAFGVHLSITQAATLSIVILICSIMPSLGGLGPTEGGLTAALHLFGVSLETAIAITLLERAVSYVLSTCAGSIAVATLGGRRFLMRNSTLKEADLNS